MSKKEIKAIEELARACNHDQPISEELAEHLKDWYGIELKRQEAQS